MGSYLGYIIIGGIFSLVGMVLSGRLKAKFTKYNQMPIESGLSGAEVADKMLNHYGISGVRIVEGRGMLTDHYNPASKTISLSPAVFRSRSVGAAAVAAHETGHAIQHATAYSMLNMRSNLVPVVQFSSKAQQMLMMFFMFGIGVGVGGQIIAAILAVTFGVTALFSLVTLPVEFDASKRALVWLDNAGITRGAEYDGAKDALWWAAMTYVSQALSALVMFLFFLLKFLNNR